jgi:hypothetical protein
MSVEPRVGVAEHLVVDAEQAVVTAGRLNGLAEQQQTTRSSSSNAVAGRRENPRPRRRARRCSFAPTRVEKRAVGSD